MKKNEEIEEKTQRGTIRIKYTCSLTCRYFETMDLWKMSECLLLPVDNLNTKVQCQAFIYFIRAYIGEKLFNIESYLSFILWLFLLFLLCWLYFLFLTVSEMSSICYCYKLLTHAGIIFTYFYKNLLWLCCVCYLLHIPFFLTFKLYKLLYMNCFNSCPTWCSYKIHIL